MSWLKTPAQQTGGAELANWTEWKKSSFKIVNGTNYINFLLTVLRVVLLPPCRERDL